MMSKYTLTLTARQAAEISHACEILARLRMAQLDMALRELPLEGYLDYDLQRAIEHQITPHLKQDRRRGDEIAWDLYQVIRHRLAWDAAIEEGQIEKGERRKWPEMMGVCFDEPMKKGDEPLAVIVGGDV
jgi:hypothetical protein